MRIPLRAWCAAVPVACVLFTCKPAVVAAQPVNRGPAGSFTPLGDLMGGQIFSAAYGVSADGTTVVGLSNATNGAKAFRWQSGMLMDLDDLSGGVVSSRGIATSANGSVVVGQGTSASGPEAFRWDGDLLGLSDLDNGAFNSSANGVSANGLVIAGTGSSANGTEAFRWESGVLSPLGDLDGGSFNSEAAGVSANGLIIAGTGNSSNGTEAFLWEDDDLSPLGDLDGGDFFSTAHGISSDGMTVVGQSATDATSDGGGMNAFVAFRWQSGGMESLGDLAGGDYFSEALATSGDGSIVVGSSATGSVAMGQTEAFIWGLDGNAHMYSLRSVLVTLGVDLTDWVLLEATGVSDDGMTVVGTGINPNGNMEAFIATVPEPGSLLLVAGGALAVLRRRRRS